MQSPGLRVRTALTAVGTLLLPLILAVPAGAQPATLSRSSQTATLDPTEGVPGTRVTAAGSGWEGCNEMTISGWGKELTSATVSAQGDFSRTFEVPAGASSGDELVQFSPGCSHSTWMPFVKFTVTAEAAGQGHAPAITRSETFVEGVLVYARVFYSDPDGDTDGFGFRGANGSGWAEESHPFSSPSYGRVIPGGVEYPFNHACGQPNQYESDVEFWVYDKTNVRSPSITIHLSCSA